MKASHSTMTQKGQITIPAYIRSKFELNTGNKIEFIVHDNSIIIKPINKSINKLSGILSKPKKSLSLEEMDNIIKSGYDRN